MRSRGRRGRSGPGPGLGRGSRSSARSPKPEQRRNVTRDRRGRGSTRAQGWGSRWAASGRLRGFSRRSPAGSGAAAPPGPPAAGGTWRGAPPRPASISSPSMVSVSGRRHEGVGETGGGVAAGWEARPAALGGRAVEGCPRVGAESAAIWASHGRRVSPLPPAVSSLAGSSRGGGGRRSGLRDRGWTALYPGTGTVRLGMDGGQCRPGREG